MIIITNYIWHLSLYLHLYLNLYLYLHLHLYPYLHLLIITISTAMINCLYYDLVLRNSPPCSKLRALKSCKDLRSLQCKPWIDKYSISQT